MHRTIASFAALLALSATACGQSSSAAPDPLVDTNLTVTIYPGFIANGKTTILHLRCAPAAGTLHDPAAACRALAAHPQLLAPLAPCVGLPDTGGVAITGTLGKRKISLRFPGGCGAARLKVLRGALGLQQGTGFAGG
jgi:hypothetical protein